MDETTSDSGGQASPGFDLSQFYQVFFEEAGENLDRMEQLLLGLDIEAADDEELNAVFRCAHSIKGGAATFGFADVAELTHQMETLLDKLRRHELAPTAPMVDVLLAAGDALRAQLARHQAGGGAQAIDTAGLLADFRAMVCGDAPVAAPVVRAAPVATPAPASDVRVLELTVGPLDNPAQADSLADLFSEITDLGTIEPLDAGRDADGLRRFKVITTSSDNDLLELCTFHVAREHLRLAPHGPGYGFHAGAPGAPGPGDNEDLGYGFFDRVPDAPATASSDTPAASAAADAGASTVAAPRRASRPESRPASAPEASTLRVSVEKVDQLINLVGELVITQAMLAQNSRGLDAALSQQLSAGLADLDRNTRDLQEAVMSIRMIPMSIVFSRFPRMLRDLAAKLGKKVEMVTQGEATELDKGLVEKITDPLTHLVRNSADHGIESPEERAA